ncbi:MAG: DNA polymerase IV [Candidatus Micrarchaeota archaeon]
MERIVLHLDLDYFFAQVEERQRPEIASKPVVVCIYSDVERGRGAVSTANYIARKFGVHSGIAIFQARRLLAGKNAVFLPANHELYGRVSLAIAETLLPYADAFEQASVDEFYLEISSSYRAAEELAKKIKRELVEKFGLTCSVGVGPNKLIAKMAASFKKPDGLTVVSPVAVQSFLDPLDVDKIPGIGQKTNQYLQSKNIRKIAELRMTDRGLLAEELGKNAAGMLFEYAHGIDNSVVANAEEQKQFSRIKTLKEPAESLEAVDVEELIADIVSALEQENLVCRVIGINIIDSGMRAHTRSKTLPQPTRDGEVIRKVVIELLREFFAEASVPVRRVGVRVERLESRKGQKSLGEF